MGDFVDLYCERIGPGFWGEPLNALTNIAFFVAAFFAWQLARRNAMLKGSVWTLIFFLLCIGGGSFAFHTLASSGAEWADVVPILLYQIAFIILYSRNVMRFKDKAVQRQLILFFLLIVAFKQIPSDILNGSLDYFPALIFLGRFAYWHYKNAAREKNLLLIATGTFILSLIFRSLDMQFCDEIPLGLHFAWHILNGFLLYLTARAYILNARK